MTLADSNLWLALALTGRHCHDAASAWLADRSATDGVSFCRSTQTTFLRPLTTKAVLDAYGSRPLTNEEAWQIYESISRDDRISYLREPPGLEMYLGNLASRKVASPKLIEVRGWT